ncbi:PHO85 cyclin-1 [Kickxella alabastrina]|uniref:PHO85 cyclin-1 n=1 Tax=Kickxella alabastrina TaxID=61397 RepID=A0ACC1I2H2_9FUNG|nr:PHO85 cyclin-1 [Kickxella alabastrina]
MFTASNNTLTATTTTITTTTASSSATTALTLASTNSSSSSSSNNGAIPPQTLHTLYHIPPTLSAFTVDYLSKLFSAVEKPNSKLKRPDRPLDQRRFPEFRYFIRTLLINGRISADTLVHALIYLSRFHQRVSSKQSVVEEGAKHKLFLAALLVASKFCDDRYPLATITVCEFLPRNLLSLAEINRMERAFLKIIRYKLIVDRDELALLLSKHGIDIRQIARTIAQRLGIDMSKHEGVVVAQSAPVPLVFSTNGIPQRAVAGHSISARIGRSGSLSMVGAAVAIVPPLSMPPASVVKTGSARLTGAMPGGSVVLHNAYLESSTAKRSQRISKPLPVPFVDITRRQREAMDSEKRV